MKDLSGSIKKVLVVYLFLIVGLISYIAYFQVFKAPEIADKPQNKRLWAERNKVLRGTIYDRNKNPLTTSQRKDVLTQKRQYVYGDLYAHVLGYVDPRYGLTGLENQYDSELRKYNSVTLKSFLKSLNIKDAFRNRDEKEEKVGNGLITTLDTNLQKVAYEALGNNKGSIVALDPKTGEILASVSKPSFNPNDLENVMNQANSGKLKDNPLINRAVSGMYPPGSTFKVVTLASALENLPGVTSRTFEDNGKIQFNSKDSLKNLDGNAYGNLSLKQALAVSSNVVFGTLALELGNDKLKATAEKFGFNQNVPSDGTVLDTSKFPTLKSYEKGNIAQSGIGQSSILATPMEMALVASTIANDGVMMEPRLVNEVVNKDGELVRKISPKSVKTVISKDNANIIKDYMRYLVAERVPRDSSWNRAFGGLDAAGKTGTADYKLANGTDATPHSWFIGFAPANNPKVAVAVIVENGGAGGGIAAQLAGRVMRAALGK
ncbi:peptidoglycan D,D-transpeptidase FtsI family protein [Clostridium fallax]|uniref:Cell division protein FtsI/penicillin-binding protein 2 n=1 Tax=Clostridium fallax TaxID=1533 RepID=A0A1M4VL86_9CLOT|nr:penicillin-binding protein 2 [Clostridium fallax]SHE69801.1 Cell division protein FtsI/penicillin-binding protein 2 [Clostridium fallax]SQB22781.1 peptidoglycan glycosyltransferase [Clostridium fallax]